MSEYIAHPTNENLRLRVTLDDCPSKPYNDGGFPIWRIEPGNYGGRAEQETDITSYVTPGELDHAIGHLLGEHGSGDEGKEIVARYLRIFWGVTFMEMWHSGSYWYLTCDPAEWRKEFGVDDEITKREGYTEHAFTEWEAWVEGDVHLAWPEQRVQREVKTTTIYPDGTREDDFRSDEEWIETEDVGPVGGFYGDLDEDMRRDMLWQFGWPSHACKHCGEGIVNDVNHGWVDDDVPFDERDRFTHCRMGVMMHVRGPKHEPKEIR